MDKLSSVFEIEDFLSQDDVNFLSVVASRIPKTYNKADIKKAFTCGFDYGLIKKSLHEKLSSVLGNFAVSDCMILEEFVPWDIHTDYDDKGDYLPHYACLFPLDYEDKTTHTLVFNEEATSQDEILSLPDAKIPLDSKIYHMVDHCSSNLLKKVTINKVCKWQIGKMIAWDRKKLHTSDNFIKNGIKQKKALVIFTNKDI